MKLLPFDKLWELANAVKSGGNSLYYHPCCDVWTSRGSAAKRASHSRHLKWGRLLLNLDKNIEDKKIALLGKMTEEGWRLPAVLNNSCHPQPRSTTQMQNAFRLHIPDLPQQDFQPSIASGNFILPSLDASDHQDPGNFYLYQRLPCHLLIYFKRKPSKHTVSRYTTTTSDKATLWTWTLTTRWLSCVKS